jgi:hypothetical protein
MVPGERAAVEGVLARLRPDMSIEIGIAKGGSLECVAAYSRHVHAFDLVADPGVTRDRFPNVTLHIGDSHVLLADVLHKLVSAGERVGFVLVDGDHTAAGVRRDLEDLLSSPAISDTVILVHDTLHPRVRAGIEQVDFLGNDRVVHVDLDFVPGRVFSTGPHQDELWLGLGVIVVGNSPTTKTWPATYAAPDVFAAWSSRSPVERRQLAELERELMLREGLLRAMECSLSWRLTAPLRKARHLSRRLR